MSHTGMVHALAEIYRVIKPGGVLIDLRVLSKDWQVQVSSQSGNQFMGYLANDVHLLADDEASQQALQKAQAQTWFKMQQSQQHPYFYYWDTPSELREFADREWPHPKRLDEAVYKKTAAAWAAANADAQVRIQMPLHLATWLRLDA